MLTRFGRFCRKLRIDNAELLLDMAGKLGVSAAFLSKVENGRSKPPVEWEKKIAGLYELNYEQLEELKESFNEARSKDVIQLNSLKQDEKDMMFAFARKLDSMDDEEKDKWKKMLKM